MIHHGKVLGKPLVAYSGTQASIEALSGLEAGMTAFATDLEQWGYYDGTDWQWGTAAALGLDDLTDVDAPSPTDGDVLSWDETESAWVPVASGGGGSSTFVGLSDTPASFSGQAGKVVTVNETEDGLIFADAPDTGFGFVSFGVTVSDVAYAL
jgi:hypothetical protein